MDDPPRVSAIVVNWNGAPDLEVELPTLVAQQYPDLEVIVVDNGSQDDSHAVVERHGAKWLPLGENRGLAGALNEGAQSARGDLLLFLNNDMDFPPDFVERMVRGLLDAPAAFAADAEQLDWEGKNTVHACTRLERARWPRGDIPGWRFAQHDVGEPTPCVFASAANLLARREDFWALGGWDAAFPVGWEDVDLCWRAWGSGRGVVYVPGAVCRHRVAASTASTAGSAARLRGSLYGSLRFALKHLPWPSVWAVSLRALVGALGDVVRRRGDRLRARADVLRRVVREAPGLLRARRSVYGWGASSPRAHIARLAKWR